MWPPPPGGVWVLDLDGVIWLSGRPIPGVDEAVARLRGAGVRVVFATNNSSPTRAELRRRLDHCGIGAADEDLLRSADVAAGLLQPGTTALVLGDDGIIEALGDRGVAVVPDRPADAVVVGWTRAFTFDAVDRAARAVREGARLVGTNEDATFPTPEGLVPGAGALLAAVATAAETTPEVAGKPHKATADALAAMVPAGDLRVVVGDRPSTDGLLAAQLGVPFALVFSGVTREGDPSAGSPAEQADPAATAKDLLALVKATATAW
ncbi:MAG TPA: HAD-IIA family hydrolase [Acidimicrobiales bacterium]|jgi:HAD superfamily hydrolase (TIGR01450 family)|nr:HAD-IIA family hydrolase [Acidimicrobiales bacterium]